MVTPLDIWTPHFCGLDDDTRPDKEAGARNGSTYTVIDTGALERYDEENDTWYDQNPTP